jgi:hypothetical protein
MVAAPVAADTLIFLGPTLSHEEAGLLLRGEYHPPARMGDVYRLLSARVRRIVLIDGLFHGVPSVWHREILEAMSEGVEVVGASSMGALRAAELHTFGMIGIGEIFEWYRDGIIDGDDEVALVHGESDAAYRSLSLPLVNLRATFARLVSDGLASAEEHDAALAWLKSQPYPDRSLRSFAASPVVERWPPERAAQLMQAAADRFVDLKRADAIRALRYAAETTPRRPGTPLPDAHRAERAMWRIGRGLRGTVPAAPERVAGQTLVSRLPIRERVSIEEELARRAFLVAWAQIRGVECPDDDPTAAARDEAWLDANGLTAASFDRLARDRARAAWLCERGPAAFGLAPSEDPSVAFIADWARLHGITVAEDLTTERDLVRWLVDAGPAHFGLPFYAESAVADELRLTGRASELSRGATA